MPEHFNRIITVKPIVAWLNSAAQGAAVDAQHTAGFVWVHAPELTVLALNWMAMCLISNGIGLPLLARAVMGFLIAPVRWPRWPPDVSQSSQRVMRSKGQCAAGSDMRCQMWMIVKKDLGLLLRLFKGCGWPIPACKTYAARMIDVCARHAGFAAVSI